VAIDVHVQPIDSKSAISKSVNVIQNLVKTEIFQNENLHPKTAHLEIYDSAE